jgi:hypothetical protein
MTTHSLKIVYDTNPYNPWTTDDGLPPLVAIDGDNIESYGFDNRDPFIYLLNLATPTQLTTIRQLLKLDPEDDLYSHYNIDRDTETLELIAMVLQISTYRWTSRGYSQGQAIDCIFIATPAFAQSIGRTDTISPIELESESKLLDAYAWGDVYGYQLTEHTPLYTAGGILATETQDEIIDSCYGFYGDE